MRFLRRPLGAILSLSLCGVSVLAQTPQPAAPQAAPAANAVAATVNGQAIPETAVQRSLSRVPPAKQADERPRVINFLIDQTLRDQFLIQMKINVEAKDIESAVTEMKNELQKEKKDFAKELEALKLTEAELRDHIAADIRWGRYADERANDKVLKQLFDAQKYLFDGSMVHARHILLTINGNDPQSAENTLAQVQAIKQAINQQVADGLAKLPADTDNLTREKKRQALLEEAFAAQAKARSACPSKEKGGDVDWFQGVGFMVEPFSRAAFAMKPFEMSEPVKTPFGIHLILVIDRKPGRDVKFEDVKEMVKEHYCELLHNSIINDARQRSKIVINK